jgi:hypothetical protein
MPVQHSAARKQEIHETPNQQKNEQASLLDIDFSDTDSYARGLQRNLSHAFAQGSETRRLSLGARLRIIVGLAATLWLAIGLVVALFI